MSQNNSSKTFNFQSRTKGRQMMTSPTRRGQVGQGTLLGKFVSLYEGEPYVDPGKHNRAARIENEKKVLQVHKTPFKPSSPTKRTTGPGSYYGTLGPIFAHEQEYEVERPSQTLNSSRGTKQEHTSSHSQMTSPRRGQSFNSPRKDSPRKPSIVQ